MSGSKALLWIREISSVVARPLWGTEGASYPFWSPDGNNIGFFADGKLKKITLPTGMIETICRVDRPAGGTWNNQDVIIFAPSDGQEGLYRISSAGGDASLVMRSGTGRVHRWPFFLPDGRRFGVSLDHLGVLYLGALDSKKTERLLFDAPGAAFAEPDYLLFWRDRQLVGQRFDLRGGRLLDETFVIADDVARDAMRPHFSVSRAGALAFRQQAPHETRPQWVDRSGRRVGPIDELSGYRYVETGPDGRTISATQFEPLTQLTTTQLIDLQTHRKSRVTSLRGANGLPVWSRDRSKIAFTVGDFVDTKPGLYAITAGGSRSEALLLQKHVFATDWSSDDRFILFQAEHPDSGWDIRMMPISGDRTPVPLLTTRANEHSACLSPTGRWLAFVSDVSGSPEVYVARFPEMTERRRISPAGGMTPAWRADGKELFFMASDGFLTAVAIVDGEQFRTSTLEPLFQLRMTTYRPTFARGVSVTEDGSRFLVPWYAMLDNKPPQLEPITMVLNWRPPVRPLDDGQAATGASATARSNERR